MTAALEEVVAAETVNADRPESNLNLGLLAASAGEPQVAEVAYRQAILLDRSFVPAYANLADLYRAQDRESDAESTLQAGLAAVPDSARSAPCPGADQDSAPSAWTRHAPSSNARLSWPLPMAVTPMSTLSHWTVVGRPPMRCRSWRALQTVIPATGTSWSPWSSTTPSWGTGTRHAPGSPGLNRPPGRPGIGRLVNRLGVGNVRCGTGSRH